MNSTLNQALLERYYAAFAARDGAAMGNCYSDDATFRDPVFDLHGPDIGAMWRMLCSRGADLRIEFSDLAANSETGSANWEAWYSFSASGRPVHNIVTSRFHFLDGKIIEQVDRFNFWRWTRQALGPVGVLLGWTPFVHRKVRANADRALKLYVQSELKNG